MGSLYRSQHELVLVFKNGAGEHRNNVQLGKFGRYRTNVWSYPGVNSLRAGREQIQALGVPDDLVHELRARAERLAGQDRPDLPGIGQLNA